MVTKYSSISTRKLSNALKILTFDKSIVAMSDYNEFYKTAKLHLLTSTLGTNAQVCFPKNMLSLQNPSLSMYAHSRGEY